MAQKVPLPEHAIPATILTGFLGAGKTTFLNYLLQEQKGLKIAVIINEIGAVNIDNQLTEFSEDSVVEMSNGCICCTVRTDLLQAILKLLKNSKFDYLVIEATGLADPGPIAQTFFNIPELQPYVKLDSVITLVDAMNFKDQCRISPTTEAQVEMADFILLNKVDCVDRADIDSLKERLKELNSHATIHETVKGRVPLDLIWDKNAFFLDTKLLTRPDLLDETVHRHDHEIKSITLTYDQIFKLDVFEAFLRELSARYHILRSKGILHFDGYDRRSVFHGVNDRYSMYWDRPWKKDEVRQSVLVFIGKDLPEEDIKTNLNRCLK